MKYKNIGNTSTKIPVIGQGCMGIGGYLSKDSSQNENQVKALKMGINLGMTFIDTAEVYGNGYSEEVVGKAIKGLRDKVFIATKVSPENLSYKDIIKSAEGSLHKLKTDYLDLYQIHWPNPKIPISETMRAMQHLVKEGKIRHIGLSNFSLRELKEAREALSEADVVSTQVEYNLFDRSIEDDILPYCEDERILTIAYSPLDQGRVTNGGRKIEELQAIADKYNKTIAQVTLSWLISHSTVVTIPKASSEKHIKENASSSDFDVTIEDCKEINRLFCQERVYIPTERIKVSTEGEGNRKVYQTIEDAIENKLGFVPSPFDLAQSLEQGEVLKPVRLIPTKDKSGRYEYDLIEGRIRYWAWVIAYKGEKPIPVYVRDN